MGAHDELFDDTVMQVPEIAAALTSPVWTVRRLAREEALEAHREFSFGSRLFIAAAAVRALQAQRRHVWTDRAPTESRYRRRVRLRQAREVMALFDGK